MHRRLFLLSAAVSFVASTTLVFAAEPEIDTNRVAGVGAGGYDVVSYFSGTPTEGKAELSSTWKGVSWHFSSADSMKAFEAAPEKYAPQYGGYCAYAVSKGATAPGDPEAWSVVDGKLYLNLSKSIRSTWQKDTAGNIAAANANWPKVLE
jgi:YHS domain-containing protein